MKESNNRSLGVRLFASTFLALAVLLAPSAQAASITLTNSDALGSTSWTNKLNWNTNVAPAAGNDYFTGPYTLRTPADLTNIVTFAGQSLTIDAGGQLAFKHMGNFTVANLILNGGTLSLAGSANTGTPGYVTNAGNAITLAAGTTSWINTDTSSRSIDLRSPISGAGNLVINNIIGGLNGVVLSGSNSFTGIVIITNNSQVVLNTTNGLGTPAGATYIAAGSTLNINGKQPILEPIFVSGAGINNAGAIINNGAGLVNLGFNGAVTITLQGNATFGGSNRFDLLNGAKLIGNGYKLTKAGASEIVFNGIGSTGLGDIDIQAGTLTIQGANSVASLGNSANGINVMATLNFWAVNNAAGTPLNKVVMMQNNASFNNNSGTTHFSGPITLTGTANFGGNGTALYLYGPVNGANPSANLVKNGSTLLYLTSANYNGNTLINGGTLVLGPLCNLENSSSFTVNSGATLDVSAFPLGYVMGANQTLSGSGTVTGKVAAAGSLVPGSEGVVGTLTFLNALALADKTVLRYDLSSITTNTTVGSNDLVVAKDLALDGTIYVFPSFTGAGPLLNTPYTLIRYTGALNSTANFVLGGDYTGTFDTSAPGEVRLTITSTTGSTLTWKGDNWASLWDLGLSTNWLNAGLPDKFNTGDAVVFDNTGSTNPPVNIAAAVSPASVLVNSTANYTFTGTGGIIGGSLTKAGTGTLTINNNNNYAGGTLVKNGILRVGAANAMGANNGVVTVTNGAQVDLNGVDQSAKAYTYYLSGAGPDGSGAIRNGGGTTLDSVKPGLKFINLAGNTTLGGVTRYDLAMNGQLNGNGYRVTKVGNFHISVRGSVFNVAEFIVNEGRLYSESVQNVFNTVVTVNPGGMLGAYASDSMTAGMSNSATINLNGGTFGAEGAQSTASGPVIWNGPVYVNAPSYLNSAQSGNANATVRLDGPIYGTANLRQLASSSRPVWANANNDATYSGTYTVDASAVLWLGGANGSVGSGLLVNNGTVEFRRTNASAFASGILGIGTVTHQNGAGALTLGGYNTMQNLRVQSGNNANPLILAPGSVTIASTIQLAINNNLGRLQIEPGAYLKALNLQIGEAANFAGDVVQNGGDVVLDGQMRVGHWSSETSAYTMNGGTLTLTAPAASVGEVNGIIMLGVDGTGILLQKGGVIRAAGLTLDQRTDTAGTDTYAMERGTLILGPRGLTSGNNGASANNSVAIFLGGGILSASASWSSPRPMTLTGTNGSVTIDPGANTITLSGALTGAGGLVKAGNGILNLNGTSPYTGNTVVNAGLLSVGGILGSTTAGAVQVNGGALAGAGTVNPPVTVASGGALVGGALLATGKLMISNNVTLNDGSRLVLDLGATAAGANDLIGVASNLTANGTVMVDFNFLTGAPEIGVPYTIATGLVVNATAANFASGSRFLATFAVSGGAVTATFGAGTPGLSLAWRGDGAGNAWQVGGPLNWWNGTANDYFSMGDSVTFDDAGNNAAPINLSGLLLVSNLTVNATKDYVFAGSGAIAGPTALTKLGSGALTLYGANAYSGKTVVGGGTLAIAGDSSLGLVPAGVTPGYLALNGRLAALNSFVLSPNRGLVLGPATGSGTGVIEVTGTNVVWYAGIATDGYPNGVGELQKTGAGTLLLDNYNTYLGGTRVSAGTLILNKGGSTGAIRNNLTVESGATVQTLVSDAFGYGGSGAGGVRLQVTNINLNGGSFIHAGTANFSLWNMVVNLTAGSITAPSSGGAIDLGNGTVVNSFASATPSTIGGVNVRLRQNRNLFNVEDGPAAVDLQITAPLNYVSGDAAAASVVKDGPGTLLIGNITAYPGPTDVRNGTLALGPGGTLAVSTPIIVRPGATLDVTRLPYLALAGAQVLDARSTVAGNVIINSGTTISPGDNVEAATAAITSNLVLNPGGRLNFSLANVTAVGGGVNDLISVGGNLIINGNGVTTIWIYQLNSQLASGVYRLINYAGALVGNPANLVVAASGGVDRYAYRVDASVPGQINLVVTGSPASLTWQGAISANWDFITPNWFNPGTSQAATFLNGDLVTLDASSANGALNLLGAVYPGSFTVDGAKNYLIGGGGKISGGVGIVKNGPGLLSLNTANDFTGPVIINGGLLKQGASAALGLGTNVVINSGGQLDVAGFGLTTRNATFVISGAGPDGSGALLNTGGDIMNIGLRNLVLAGDATINNSGRIDLGDGFGGRFGIINGNGFRLTKNGLANMPFHASASNLAELVINGGLIYCETWDYSLGSGNITVNYPGKLGAYGARLNNPNITLNSGTLEASGSAMATWIGPITLNGACAFNTTGGYGSADMAVLGPVGGSGGLIKVGANRLYLGGTNTYTGDTLLSGGSIQLFPTASLQSGVIRVGSGATLDVSGYAAVPPGTVNLALQPGVTASQLTTRAAGGAASRAIDGNTDGNFANNSVTHTVDPAVTNEWWEADLGSAQRIDRVHLWFRTDCCNERNENLLVTIYDSTNVAARVALWSQYVGPGPLGYAGASSRFLDVPGVAGRVVRVEHPVGTPILVLSLAEVQVFQFPAGTQAGGFPLGASQTLAGSGTVVGAITANAGSVIQPGAESVAGTLSNAVGGLTLNAGASLVFDLSGTAASGNDLLVVGGQLKVAGPTVIKLNPLSSGFDTLPYTIIKCSGQPLGKENLSVVADVRGAVAVLDFNTTNEVRVLFTSPAAPATNLWTGDFMYSPQADWDLISPNWDFSASVFQNGDNVIFSGVDVQGSTNINLVGSLNPGTITVGNETEVEFMMLGSGGLGGLSLTKNFSGKLTLANSGANTWGGPTVINGGTIQLGTNSPFGSLSPSAITNDGELIVYRSDNCILPNQLNGAGSLRKLGSARLTLSGNNAAFTGPIYVDAGVLMPVAASAVGTAAGGIRVADGATFDINGQNYNDEPVTIIGAGVGGAGAVINTGAQQQNALRSLTLAGNATVGVPAGGRWDLRGIPAAPAALMTGGQPYNLAKVGRGFLGLVDTAADPALGDIDIVEGTVGIAQGSWTGINVAGDANKRIIVRNTAILDLWAVNNYFNKIVELQEGATLNTSSGNSILGGPLNLLGNAQVGGAGGTILTLTNDLGGTYPLVKVGAGTVRFGNLTPTGSLNVPANITAGILEFLRSDTYTLTNLIWGPGSLQHGNGSGPLILANTNIVGAINAAGNSLVNRVVFAAGSSNVVTGTINVGLNATIGAMDIMPDAYVWANNLFLGQASAQTGIASQLGGTVIIGQQFRVGHYPNNVSIYTLGGGLLDITNLPAAVVNQSGVAEQNGVLYIGIDGIGVFYQTGGVARANAVVVDARGGTAAIGGTNCTYIMEGGTLIPGANGIRTGSLDANTTYTVRLGGGVISASATWNSVLNMTLSGVNGNVTFDPGIYTITLSGALTGSGGLNKTGVGTLIASSANNNIGGSVVVSGGALNLNGSVAGPVTAQAGSVFSPGASIGTVTVNNSVTLGGVTLMELNRAAAQNCDLIRIPTAAPLICGGTLLVTNLGPSLFGGDTFKLFDAQPGRITGEFANVILPPLPTGMYWDATQLYVNGAIKVMAPPIIVFQPQNTLRNVGATATFTVGVSPSGSTFQWYFNGTTPVPGAAANLTLNNIQLASAGNYSVVVSSGLGSVTSRLGALTVNQFPIAGDDNLGIFTNRIVVFDIAPLLLNDSDPDGDPVSFVGVTTPSLYGGTVSATSSQVTYTAAANFTGQDQITYTISDGRGAQSAGRVLLNLTRPVASTNNYSVGIMIPDGSPVGLAIPVIVNSSVGPVGKVRVNLNIAGTWNGDLYCYLAKGTNISVLLNRVGRRDTDAFGYADPGLNVTFDDAATNGDAHVYRLPLTGSHTTPLGTALTGEWAPDGRAADPANVLDTTARALPLSTFNGLQANGEWVLFVADLELGNVHTLQSWSLEITGDPLPIITNQPVSRIVECGQSASFTVAAHSDIPITGYQWQYNGVDIPGATSATFAIPATRLVDAGAYRVRVGNANGLAYSQPAALTVTDTTPPAIAQCAPPALVDLDYNGLPDPVNQVSALPDMRGGLVATDNAFATVDLVVAQIPAHGSPVTAPLPVVFSVTDKSNNVAYCTNFVTVNKRPVAYGTVTPFDTAEEALLAYPLLAADAETAATDLTYTMVAFPTNGVLTGMDGNGVVTNRPVSVSYLPVSNYFGADSFSFVVDDGRTTSLVAVVELNVTNVYDAPYTPPWQTNQVGEGALLPIPLVASSADRLPLTFAITREPQFGTVTLINGVATYQPNPGFNGVDTFEYTAADTLGGASAGQVRVEVQFASDVLPYAFTNALAVAVGSGPRAVVALDFLKDYKLDLAVANSNANTVSLLRNVGDGTFTNVYELPVAAGPVALALGDFNNDRLVDLVVLCAEARVVQIWKNNGLTAKDSAANAFSLALTVPLAGANPVALLAADLNKDLYCDLVVVDGGDGASPGTLEILMHQKYTTAPIIFDTNAPIAVGRSPSAVAVGALSSAAAKPEIVVANAGDDSISILKLIGYGEYVVATNYPVGRMPVDVAVADLNGDKKLDIVTANYGSDDVTVITNRGALQMVVAASYGVRISLGLGPRALAVGNYVKASATEAKLDLAVVMQEAGQPVGHVAVLRGNGINSLDGITPLFDFFWFDPGAYFEVGRAPQAIVAGDFNGDKLTDLAVANFGSDDVSILLNNWTPKAFNQKLTFVEDFATNIVLGGTFGPLDYVITVWPTNGTITPSNNTQLYNLTTNPVLRYEPFTNRFGRDLIKYYVNDGTKTSKWATLTITILPVNDPPVISNKVGELGVVEVPEDSLVKITNFITYAWPGPWGEEKQRLTYYFKPVDKTLFKGAAGMPKIVGTNLVLWFTPTNNVFGETLVELWAKDSGRVKTNKPDMRPYGEWDTTPTQTFKIVITNVNDAPKFLKTAQLAAKSVPEDGQTNWVFDIYDIDSPMSSMAVSLATASTTVLDPNNPAQVWWTIADTSVPKTNKWTVTLNVKPAADAYGVVPLTVKIDDGTNSSTWNTTLRVLPVNDRPTVALKAGMDAISVNAKVAPFTGTFPVIDFAASSVGPANEKTPPAPLVGQKFTLFKVTASNLAPFAVPPAINPVTGELTIKTRVVPATTVVTLTIVGTDSGGTANGGVAVSAPVTVTLTISP